MTVIDEVRKKVHPNVRLSKLNQQLKTSGFHLKNLFVCIDQLYFVPQNAPYGDKSSKVLSHTGKLWSYSMEIRGKKHLQSHPVPSLCNPSNIRPLKTKKLFPPHHQATSSDHRLLSQRTASLWLIRSLLPVSQYNPTNEKTDMSSMIKNGNAISTSSSPQILM